MRNVNTRIWVVTIAIWTLVIPDVLGLTNFNDGITHDIDYVINDYVVVDFQSPVGMETTVNFLSGSVIKVNNSPSEASLCGYNDSQINIKGGPTYGLFVGHVETVDNSQLSISGSDVVIATVEAKGNSHVSYSGRVIFDFFTHDDSQLIVTSGRIINLSTYGNSQVYISGGEIESDFVTRDNSQVTFSGGTLGFSSINVGGSLDSTSVVTFEGTDFKVDEVSVAYGELTSILGDHWFYEPMRQLTGTLLSGESFDREFYIGQNAKIILTGPEPPENTAPTADAGPDQSVFVTGMVSLDGSLSDDADGDPLTYNWSFILKPLGSTTTISGPTTITPTFVVDKAGTYEVQLIVNDGTDYSEPDTVIINTLNSIPIAEAGPARSVYVGDNVTLDGSSSSDVDDDPLTYSWSLILVPSGSSAALLNPTSMNPTFVIDVFGDYEVQLIVNDGTVDSDPDNVIISTLNSAPVADTGPDQMLLAPIGGVAEVILDGSDSTDVDGDELTYQWTWDTYSVDGVNPTIELPVGVHNIQLIVNDGTVDSEPDGVVIEVVDVTIALAEQLVAVLTNKLNMLEQINSELEKEQQVYDSLEELLASGVYTGLAHGNMVKAKQKIHSALQHQGQAKNDLEKSVEKLADALEALGSPVEI